MITLLRLLAAAGVAFLATHLLARTPYIEQVFVAFAVTALAAGAVREGFLTGPKPLAALIGDVAISLMLAVLMILAARAAGRISPNTPSPLLPAMAWPIVDLWRPHQRRRRVP